MVNTNKPEKKPINFITKISQYKLVSFDEAPGFLKANPFILTGYRVHFSFWMCLYSLLRLHNESGNIITHLFASIYFLSEAIQLLYSEESLEFTIPLALYCFGCFLCFLLSTCFHTFNSHSQEKCALLLRCDFAGIKIYSIFMKQQKIN